VLGTSSRPDIVVADPAPAQPPDAPHSAARPGWLDLAWLVLWVLGLAAILHLERWESVPCLLTVISFAVMAAMAWAMMWHARLRRAADAASAQADAASGRITQENARLLATQVRFLQDASHQLRTPITIALGHAELLARSLADQAEQRDIHVVVGELNRLRRLSERLLVIAASENPEFLRREPIPLGQLAAETLRRWEPAAQRRWQLGRLDPATVQADGERLRLALDALLENAVQHTGPDDIIRLSVARHPRSSRAALVVEDGGSGIPAAEVAYIFDRFRTGSGPAGHAATGLGLALVLAVAHGHGGEIRVQSTPGEGSRFEFLLPHGRPQ
jgi:two-component system, OmpR family, sensor kinase